MAARLRLIITASPGFPQESELSHCWSVQHWKCFKSNNISGFPNYSSIYAELKQPIQHSVNLFQINSELAQTRGAALSTGLWVCLEYWLLKLFQLQVHNMGLASVLPVLPPHFASSLPRLVQGAAVKWQESHTRQQRKFYESCLVWLSCHSGIGKRKSCQWTITVTREQQRITFCQRVRALSLKVTMKLI